MTLQDVKNKYFFNHADFEEFLSDLSNISKEELLIISDKVNSIIEKKSHEPRLIYSMNNTSQIKSSNK